MKDALRVNINYALGFIGILMLSSCMSTRVVAQYDHVNPVPHKVTEWNFLWGLVQPKDVKTDELCQSICQFTVKNNIGYIMISAVTAGLVVPAQVEYRCCPYKVVPGEL